MKLIETIYDLLVNRVPSIEYRYQKYRRGKEGVAHIFSWFYLMKLNIQYYLFRRTVSMEDDLFYTTKKLYLNGSESSLSVRMSPEEFAKQLSYYDVISFDVFDTLIFRPFSQPSDLFYMMESELGYLNFKNIRTETEKNLRRKKLRNVGTSEVSLSEIWKEMNKVTGIPIKKGMELEYKREEQYCFANPYMLEVVKELRKLNKKYIVISDMYLEAKLLYALLKKNGFQDVGECFVSNEYGKSKSEGSLYTVVKEKYGKELKYVHVGDNSFSDIRQAYCEGFQGIIYPNINEVGMKYRTEDMSVITGSIYRGIINSHIHNGMRVYSKDYEFGFIYGGLFVLGYCEWIHKYACSHKVDKILFLARDGEILNKAYEMIYPESENEISFEYVYWSRLAATKMSSDYFRYDYFRRFLMHKLNQGYKLDEIFVSMDLIELLPEFLQEGYTKETVLNEEVAEKIVNYLQGNWGVVQNIYQEQINSGKRYFSRILENCKNVVAVDVGWAGSGAVTLNYLVNQVWDLKCEIVGLIAGTNSIYSQEPDASEALLYGEKLVSYMFSQECNRDIWKVHNPNRGHNIIVELLLASNERSFRGFYEKGYLFSKKQSEIDSEEVQKGILDFIVLYMKRMGTIHRISGRDAYAPIKLLVENEEWLKTVIDSKNFKVNLD